MVNVKELDEFGIHYTNESDFFSGYQYRLYMQKIEDRIYSFMPYNLDNGSGIKISLDHKTLFKGPEITYDEFKDIVK